MREYSMDLKFYKHDPGVCQKCDADSEVLYKAALSSGDVTKTFVLCKKCAYGLKKSVEKKNSEETVNAQPLAVEPRTGKNFCTKCGAEVDESSAFCSKCGNPIAYEQKSLDSEYKNEAQFLESVDIVCSNCGFVFTQAKKFCTNCGSPLEFNGNLVQSKNKEFVFDSKRKKVILSVVPAVVIFLIAVFGFGIFFPATYSGGGKSLLPSGKKSVDAQVEILQEYIQSIQRVSRQDGPEEEIFDSVILYFEDSTGHLFDDELEAMFDFWALTDSEWYKGFSSGYEEYDDIKLEVVYKTQVEKDQLEKIETTIKEKASGIGEYHNNASYDEIYESLYDQGVSFDDVKKTTDECYDALIDIMKVLEKCKITDGYSLEIDSNYQKGIYLSFIKMDGKWVDAKNIDEVIYLASGMLDIFNEG